jgi:hypothetical protein
LAVDLSELFEIALKTTHRPSAFSTSSLNLKEPYKANRQCRQSRGTGLSRSCLHLPPKLLTFVTITVTFPATMRFASVVGSYSGPDMCEVSGLPFGHSKSVCCWAGNDVARPMQAATTQAAVYLFRPTAG